MTRWRDTGIALASLLPFGLLLRRSRKQLARLRLAAMLGIAFVSVGLMVGCSSSNQTIPATPAGTSNVTVTATSGSLSHSTTVALTVQ